MNKIKKYIGKLPIMIVALTIVLAGCKKETEELNLTRRFSPATITGKNGETSVVLTWASSLFTVTGDVEYVVEVSKDPAFGNVEFTTTTPDLTVTITDDKIAIKQDYYARVKAVGKGGAGDSNWSVSPIFRITGEQFLTQVTSTTVTDVAVQLTWRISSTLTKITITPTAGAPTDFILTDSEKAAGLKVISGLTQSTNYSAEIFQDTKSKGVIIFKTKRSIAQPGVNIVDLTGITGDPTALVTAIAAAPSGSVIVLRRGERYNYAGVTITGGKSLSIVSALGFGTNYASLRSTGSFTMTANTTTDSLVFRDLIIKGGQIPASFGAHYLFNVGNLKVNVNKIRLDNCIIKMLRGVVRGQAGTASTTGPSTNPSLSVNNVFINNCVLDSVADFALLSTSNNSGASFKSISLTNSSFSHFRKFIDHRVFGNQSITIANCTFFDVVSGTISPAGNAIIDYSTVAAGAVNISNSIFGRTWNETGVGTFAMGLRTSGGTPSGSGNYGASDFVNIDQTANNDDQPLPVTSYSGTSLQLFTDPNNDNFKILDPTFVGRNIAGDPRWRIN